MGCGDKLFTTFFSSSLNLNKPTIKDLTTEAENDAMSTLRSDMTVETFLAFRYYSTRKFI